jgi:4-amino-4-deoxy-L-arabinose transferase-like glycosyltransferase
VRLLAGALTLLGLMYGLTGYPLLEPDEGRNAEVAREMAATHGYVLPRLDGLPYVDKPVLFFAAGAAVMDLLGPTTLAARLPPLLFTLATIGVIAWFARRRGDARAAWTAAIATGAAPLTLGFARTVIFDSALTCFVVVAWVAFYEAICVVRSPLSKEHGDQPTDDGQRTTDHKIRTSDIGLQAWHWSAIAWAAIAFAVLTKGPIGLALPLMVAIPYAVWRRAGRVLWEPVGPLLFAALALPWVMLMSQRVPHFLAYALGTETFRRLLTPALGRTGPWWYFLPILLVGALPWSLVALGGFRGAGIRRRSDHAIEPYTMFLLLWILVPLAFFSLSESKRPQYVLPLVPGIALLAAHLGHARGRITGARSAAIGLVLMGLVLAAAPDALPRFTPISADIRHAMRPAAIALAIVSLAAGVLVWWSRERHDAALLLLALPTATVPIAGTGLMQAIGRERSSAALAAAIRPALPPGAEVLAIHTLPLSLPFYLRQQVLVATATGAEFTSNYLVRDIARWRDEPRTPLRAPDAWLDAVTACARVRVFVTRAGDTRLRTILSAKLPLLAETPKYAAYGPCARSDLAAARWPVVGYRLSVLGQGHLREPSTDNRHPSP